MISTMFSHFSRWMETLWTGTVLCVMASSLPVWADILTCGGPGSSSPGNYRKPHKLKVCLGFKKGNSWFFIGKMGKWYMITQITWSVCIAFTGQLLSPPRPLHSPMHECLNVPLPPRCMVRLILFIRVIRGLEGSQ